MTPCRPCLYVLDVKSNLAALCLVDARPLCGSTTFVVFPDVNRSLVRAHAHACTSGFPIVGVLVVVSRTLFNRLYFVRVSVMRYVLLATINWTLSVRPQ